MTDEISLEQFLKINPRNAVTIKEDALREMKIILRKKYKTYEDMSKALGCSRRFVCMVLDKVRVPNAKLALEMCRETKLDIKWTIDKITPRCKYSYSYIKPSAFPIKLDENMAALIGHAFSDGHVKRVFSYSNTERKLVNKVIMLVQKLPINNLTMNSWVHNAKIIRFSSLVKDILAYAGSPIGNKIITETEIPRWIKKGNKKKKTSFIQAIFDDEGHVGKKDRAVSMCFSKNISLRRNLEEVLCDIRVLLEGFGIKRSTIREGQYYEGKNGKTMNLKLTFYGYQNLKTFQRSIGFTHPKKQKRLDKWVKNIQVIKLNAEERLFNFFEVLENHPLITAKELAKRVKMDHKAVLGFLNKMRIKGYVGNINKYSKQWILNSQAVNL